MDGSTILGSLSRSVASWSRHGEPGPLARWMDRELDPEGAPIRLAIPDWHRCLEIFAEAKRSGRDLPEDLDVRLGGLIRTTLRFSRPGGFPAADFQTTAPGGARASTLRGFARWYPRTDIARVLDWWFSTGTKEHAPPPLPAWASSERVLAILRADWKDDGDFLAVDHRLARSPCRLELFGAGRSWLGPDWSLEAGDEARSRPRPMVWSSSSAGDFAEWSYRTGDVRLTRSTLLLRGRRLALLAIAAEGHSLPAPGLRVRLSLAPGIVANALPGCRALALVEPKKRGNAQVLPLALPCLDYPTDRGGFHGRDGELGLNQMAVGRRCWLPMLVSWDAQRHRKSLRWRVLTVSERSRAVGPDRAFAARVSWGREETYIIYRSLAEPAPRAFLGHQTGARFLVGEFTTDGTVKPILKID